MCACACGKVWGVVVALLKNARVHAVDVQPCNPARSVCGRRAAKERSKLATSEMMQELRSEFSTQPEEISHADAARYVWISACTGCPPPEATALALCHAACCIEACCIEALRCIVPHRAEAALVRAVLRRGEAWRVCGSISLTVGQQNTARPPSSANQPPGPHHTRTVRTRAGSRTRPSARRGRSTRKRTLSVWAASRS